MGRLEGRKNDVVLRPYIVYSVDQRSRVRVQGVLVGLNSDRGVRI